MVRSINLRRPTRINWAFSTPMPCPNLRAADQANARIPVGLTPPHQGQGLHGVAPVRQCLGQQ